MNTDNLSILGLTIDYGPYGWLEDYDPNWTPNTTDAEGRRYRFGNQPQVAQWNLAQFGGALLPLVDGDVDVLQPGLKHYVDSFQEGWQSMMAAKLGLDRFQPGRDEPLFEQTLDVLQLAETDMTLFYRLLAEIPCEEPSENSEPVNVCDRLRNAYYKPEAELNDQVVEQTNAWFRNYRDRVRAAGISDSRRRERMNRVNPLYVLRNYLAQLAIDRSEQGDHGGIEELLEVLRHPYDEQPGKEAFAEKRPEWARHRAGCSMLSCSS
jgi:uncharacterized protein YdiU (UPF0061 family)